MTSVPALGGGAQLPSLKDFMGPKPGEAKPSPARAQSPDELLSVARQWAARGVGTITRH